MKRYLTVEEVAELLRCTKRTVHELTRTDAIPCIRLPGVRRVLFDGDEVCAWIAAHRNRARAVRAPLQTAQPSGSPEGLGILNPEVAA